MSNDSCFFPPLKPAVPLEQLELPFEPVTAEIRPAVEVTEADLQELREASVEVSKR